MARGAERQVAKEATQEPLAAAKGAVVGYARTSTAEQEAGLAAQERDLRGAGCGKVSKAREGAPRAPLLDLLRPFRVPWAPPPRVWVGEFASPVPRRGRQRHLGGER